MEHQIAAYRSRASGQMTAGRGKLRPIAGALVAAAAVTMAGCGSAATPGGAAAPAAASAAKVSVTITVSGPGGAKARHWTLRCDPPGGTHPDPAAACKVLLGQIKSLTARPGQVACPMILLNAEHATIRGTLSGRKIDRDLVDGGCDMRLWAALSKIFS